MFLVFWRTPPKDRRPILTDRKRRLYRPVSRISRKQKAFCVANPKAVLSKMHQTSLQHTLSSVRFPAGSAGQAPSHPEHVHPHCHAAANSVAHHSLQEVSRPSFPPHWAGTGIGSDTRNPKVLERPLCVCPEPAFMSRFKRGLSFIKCPNHAQKAFGICFVEGEARWQLDEHTAKLRAKCTTFAEEPL